jgi:ATP-dependent helicase/DNAse subunit B
MNQLNEVGIQGFSPSSLTQYIRDPYLFYEQRLLQIKANDEVGIDINAAEKGTIIHEVLENLYRPYLGEVLSYKDYEEMLKMLPEKVNSSFKNQYQKGSLFTGKNYLIYEITIRILKKFIEGERDFVKKGNEIIVRGLEKKFYEAIFIPELNQQIFLKGTIDRIDTLNGNSRIIDYKTGNISSTDLSFKSWEELISLPKKAALFQVMLYAYALKNKLKNDTVYSGVIPLKNFDNQFLAVHQKKVESRNHSQLIQTP